MSQAIMPKRNGAAQLFSCKFPKNGYLKAVSIFVGAAIRHPGRFAAADEPLVNADQLRVMAAGDQGGQVKAATAGGLAVADEAVTGSFKAFQATRDLNAAPPPPAVMQL